MFWERLRLPNRVIRTLSHDRDGVTVPANEVINVIRPNTQLSGGVAPVSLKKNKKQKKTKQAI